MQHTRFNQHTKKIGNFSVNFVLRSYQDGLKHEFRYANRFSTLEKKTEKDKSYILLCANCLMC